MNLTCTASCADCDWVEQATSMKAADKAADRHARATSHSVSWHCQAGR